MRLDNGALDQSFTTISAYGANAAMCHYHAVPETCAVLEPKGLYLVDSGGQYLEGTTDITRTFALGPVTEEEKKHYTMVLMSMPVSYTHLTENSILKQAVLKYPRYFTRSIFCCDVTTYLCFH